MRFKHSISAVAIATMVLGSQAHAGWLSQALESGEEMVSGAGRALEHVAQDVGKAAERAGQAAGEATGIEIPEEIQEGARGIGGAVEQAGRDTGATLEKAGRDTGATLLKAVQDTGAEAERAGDWLNEQGEKLERWFCNVMTGGAYERGEASCSVDAGVGHDDEGYYTYSPSDPGRKYRGNEGDEARTRDETQLSEFAEYLNEAVELEYAWYEPDAWMGLQRFLPPDYHPGTPWPASEGAIVPPTKSGELRGCCAGGGGGFLSLRKGKSGDIRLHGGADYLTTFNEPIYAPIDGTIVRPKNPSHNSPLTGVLIRSDGGYTATVYYVDLTPEIKATFEDGVPYRVKAGETLLGHAQDIHVTYPKEVPNHVHVTLEDPDGRRVSPEGDAVIAPKQEDQVTGM